MDDQVDVAKAFARNSADPAAQFEFAPDGETGLEMLKAESFDLVLVDLAMPPGRWGGLWLLERLSLLSVAPPAIVISGEGSQSETIQAIRLGAIDYVMKERVVEELGPQIKAAKQKSGLREASELRELIRSGESRLVEFKSTLRINLHTKKPDPAMELAVIKTIAAFLNSEGGTLLIGVSDRGETVGLSADGFSSSDKFQLHFWNIIRDSVGVEFCEFIASQCVPLDSHSVFMVSCRPSTRPVFAKWKSPGESQYQDLFFVRTGPQTEQLGTRQVIAYIADHFSEARRPSGP
ncbi:RNA-binding domain-containing protein [Luteimonas sp. A501]